MTCIFEQSGGAAPIVRMPYDGSSAFTDAVLLPLPLVDAKRQLVDELQSDTSTSATRPTKTKPAGRPFEFSRLIHNPLYRRRITMYFI
jgi:hypothetical protein